MGPLHVFTAYYLYSRPTTCIVGTIARIHCLLLVQWDHCTYSLPTTCIVGTIARIHCTGEHPSPMPTVCTKEGMVELLNDVVDLLYTNLMPLLLRHVFEATNAFEWLLVVFFQVDWTRKEWTDFKHTILRLLRYCLSSFHTIYDTISIWFLAWAWTVSIYMALCAWISPLYLSMYLALVRYIKSADWSDWCSFQDEISRWLCIDFSLCALCGTFHQARLYWTLKWPDVCSQRLLSV